MGDSAQACSRPHAAPSLPQADLWRPRPAPAASCQCRGSGSLPTPSASGDASSAGAVRYKALRAIYNASIVSAGSSIGSTAAAPERLPELAADLIRLKVDVIVAAG